MKVIDNEGERRMTKEELEKEAITRVDAFIDNFSQDIRSTLHDRLNQEDVKDFLYGLYIDSAEPREKRIAELEKENAVLKKACDETQELLDKQIEATFKLDKENTELKGLVNQYKASKCSGISLANRNMIMSDQLTKEKELLKEFVQHYKAKTIYVENMQDLLKQSEQFLNEVEK